MSKTDRTVKSEIEATSALVEENSADISPVAQSSAAPQKPVPPLAELKLWTTSNSTSGSIPIFASAFFQDIAIIGGPYRYRMTIRQVVVEIRCEGVEIDPAIPGLQQSISRDEVAREHTETGESGQSVGGEISVSPKLLGWLPFSFKGDAKKKHDRQIKTTLANKTNLDLVIQISEGQWLIGDAKIGDPRKLEPKLQGRYLSHFTNPPAVLCHVKANDPTMEECPKLYGSISMDLTHAQIERIDGLLKDKVTRDEAAILLKERLAALRIKESMDESGRFTIAETIRDLPPAPRDN